MEVLHEEPVDELKGAKLQVGRASWDPDELSVRFYYLNSRGGMSPKSPEMPAGAVRRAAELLDELGLD